MVAFRIRQLASNLVAPDHHAGAHGPQSNRQKCTRLIEGQLDTNQPSPTREGWLLLVHQVH
jgi:hypothetical protein